MTDVSKHLRPISLTPALSKIDEEFIVAMYIGPAIPSIIDPDQFGTIPKSSTTHALISMVHKWSEATDATGAAVRIVLLDYRKAFDLIGHRILVQKISSLQIPLGVTRWVCDFLMDCKQRVKLANDCFSEWGRVPSGVPQGTKLGPWLFLLMINKLFHLLPQRHQSKYNLKRKKTFDIPRINTKRYTRTLSSHRCAAAKKFAISHLRANLDIL